MNLGAERVQNEAVLALARKAFEIGFSIRSGSLQAVDSPLLEFRPEKGPKSKGVRFGTKNVLIGFSHLVMLFVVGSPNFQFRPEKAKIKGCEFGAKFAKIQGNGEL